MAEPIIMVLHPFPRYHDYKIQTSFSSRRNKKGREQQEEGLLSYLHDLGFFFHFTVPPFFMIPIQSTTQKKKQWCCPFISSCLNQHRNLHVH